jgi:hypothetical protein
VNETIKTNEVDKKIFPCPDNGCSSVFMYYRSLQNHIARGKHSITPERFSMFDTALQCYRENIEETRIPKSTNAAIDNLLRSQSRTEYDDSENLPQGWANPKQKVAVRFSDDVKR